MSLDTSDYGVRFALQRMRAMLDAADLAMVNRQLPREHVKEIARLAGILDASFEKALLEAFEKATAEKP